MSGRVSAYDGNGKFAFVSYSHKNSRIVYSVIEQLAKMGYNVWYDEGIPLIADYGGVLYDRIKNCSAFILFVSHESVCSDDVEKEAAHAISFGKPIVQIVIDESAELPPSLAYHLPKSKQYLPISCEPKEFYSKLTAVLKDCKGTGGEADIGSAKMLSGSASAKKGDKLTFGSYSQNGSTTEPIEWRVLKVEGDRALIISELVLDHQKFDDKWLTGTRWEKCALRKWLNDWFVMHAFTEAEYERILTVKLDHPNNKVHGTICGFSTEDKVFCLSADEAEEYFDDDAQRVTPATRFAESRGAATLRGGCAWWLRTLGKTNSSAVFVGLDGKISYFGMDVSSRHVSVRPAMYIKL